MPVADSVLPPAAFKLTVEKLLLGGELLFQDVALAPRSACALGGRFPRKLGLGLRLLRRRGDDRGAARAQDVERVESRPGDDRRTPYPAFYSYAYPEPPGFRDARVAHGRFDETYSEFVLPYAQVRAASDPPLTSIVTRAPCFARCTAACR